MAVLTVHSFGLAVHFKIYPIMYALPIVLYLASKQSKSTQQSFLNLLMAAIQSKAVWHFFLVSAGTFVSLLAVFYAL